MAIAEGGNMTTSIRLHVAAAVTVMLSLVAAGGAVAAPYPDVVDRAVANHAATALQPDAFERAVANHRYRATRPPRPEARDDGFDWRTAMLGSTASALLLGLVATRIVRRSRSVAT
jgi:hypothetical protein